MLKTFAIVAIPGALGGVGLLYGSEGAPGPQSVYERGYAVELGVALDETAVRAALPEGLEPAPGFTGGIAVYGGEEGWALSPLTTGYTWLDVVEESTGLPARYMLAGFSSDNNQGRTSIPLDVAVLGETHELGADGVLRVTAWPDRVTTLELTVQPLDGACVDRGAAEQPDLLTSGPGGSLGVIHMPAALDWCEVNAEASWASVTAPVGHVLGSFVPEQVLWAHVATPLAGSMSGLRVR